ncbi:AAA family ATPase [Geofilum rubicundum]|uniref:RecF/RecN/SMC N-terminal domain-containing protein n=1 Tax=Geofilum rubicundum JCM 15548 TaxID=1236989 RepID=A0A0E9LSU6_9BACT|nr:AAA family ATPase [Geofilum rubicundum]GAO28334.1 hypothetical protein JCM15548_1418 [Geofilum rubicundum JCM 15548]
MKIQNVTVNKYKAFTKKEKIPIGGSNIFIYGENGSGKSSFYYALKDFFQSSVEIVKMSELRNFNLTDSGTDCSIEVEFDGGAKNILNETTKNTNITQIIDANRLKSFLTYKHLLGVHNVKVTEKLDVFNLVVTGVLKHYKSELITGQYELGELYLNTVSESKKTIGKGKDFYTARQKSASVTQNAKLFNVAFKKLFEKPEEGETNPDYLAPEINYFLKKIYPELSIDFKRQTIRVDDRGNLNGGKLFLDIIKGNDSIDSRSPHFSLNEAKLSAIAISIFLGAIKRQSIFSPDLKPLFLDDILIGLDNENRLKLLNLLKETGVSDEDKVFKDFQIFLTTYDRHWYEVAKLNLPSWKFIEFYKSEDGPQIIHNEKTYLEKARCYFEAFDFPAAGQYLRKESERLLKSKLLETYTVGEGFKGLVKPINLETLIDRLKLYYIDLGLEPPSDLIGNLQNYKSILFNPMSHSEIESPIYRNDLELAFKTIDDLERIVLPKRTVIIEKGTHFNLSLPAINYKAQVEIAKDIYMVEHKDVKTETAICFFFKTWTRAGVEFAGPTGIPARAVSKIELLDKIKSNPYSLEIVVKELNKTFKDRGVPEINILDLKSSLTLAGGVFLNDLLENSK